MRRWWIIAVGLAAAALALGWWLREPPEAPPVAVVEAPEPTFAAVEVRAGAAQQGLTLTGVVRDATGAPVADAEIGLAASAQPSVSSLRCGVCGQWLLSCHAHETARSVARLFESRKGELAAALTTRSDAEGRFRFQQLLGTSFTVWGTAPGLGLGVKERAAPGDPVALFLPARRAIAGRLRDEAGQPVAGTVRAVSRRLARLVEARADAEGRFRLDDLGEGPFAVSATAPGLLPALEPEVEADAEPVVLTLVSPRRLEVRVLEGGQPADAVLLLEGDHLARQLEVKRGLRVVDDLFPGEVVAWATRGSLSSAPQRVTVSAAVTQVTLTLEPGGTVAVTVVDEGGQPVPGPTLELKTRGGERVARRQLQGGELSVLGPVGPGEYQLEASAEGFQPATVPVRVKPVETPVEVTLTRGTVIRGKVIDEYGRPAPGVSVLVTPTGDSVLSNDEGRFVAPVPSPGLYELHAHHSDWGGGDLAVQAPKDDVALQLEPRAGAEITVTAEGRRVEGASVTLFHSKGNFRSDRVSGADGVVLMRGLPDDSYLLVASHPDYLPSERQKVTLRDGDLQRLTAELRPGVKLTGRVIDTTGAPVAQVPVVVMPRGAEPALTDAQGQFTLAPLRAGMTYLLRVNQKGLEQLDRVTGKGGGDPVEIVVRRQAVFRGRVLGGGQPLKSFRVDDHEVTSADGRFELPLPATEDRVIVTIEAPGYEPLMADRPRTPDLGDFDLVPAPAVTGVVRDEGGAPAADAVVTCDSCEQSVLTDAQGRFSLGKPAFQREFTVLAKKGRQSGSRVVTDRALQGIEVRLRPGVRVTGTAWTPDGRPASGVEIAGVQAERREPVSAVTNADGTWSVEVAPGSWTFMLSGPLRHAEQVSLITELQGTEAHLDLGPAPGLASLTVRLAPRQGYALWLVRGELPAVGNPPLELLRAGWAQLVYQPRTERVTLTGLAPGRYTLVWSSFHASVPEGPLVVPVTVPAAAEIGLVR